MWNFKPRETSRFKDHGGYERDVWSVLELKGGKNRGLSGIRNKEEGELKKENGETEEKYGRRKRQNECLELKEQISRRKC